ncbi:uncharacterized protein LOC107272384 isoform X2 [Cephus cinctus]|uniref:Uncharacterized protein LOC107272384 isoform X2 n=1 Tax=Cephus cinctus TaxID=211228 RepID=A0AAJ7RQT0_CEPCN|nr:uncharacterized protein LOC107272384 isoform X2 [Cephus cinctus]
MYEYWQERAGYSHSFRSMYSSRLQLSGCRIEIRYSRSAGHVFLTQESSAATLGRIRAKKISWISVSSWKADLHRILLPGCSIDFPTNGDRIASRVRSCRAYYEVDTRVDKGLL